MMIQGFFYSSLSIRLYVACGLSLYYQKIFVNTIHNASILWIIAGLVHIKHGSREFERPWSQTKSTQYIKLLEWQSKILILFVYSGNFVLLKLILFAERKKSCAKRPNMEKLHYIFMMVNHEKVSRFILITAGIYLGSLYEHHYLSDNFDQIQLNYCFKN